jgi:outer membrane lipoprotein SlyB
VSAGAEKSPVTNDHNCSLAKNVKKVKSYEIAIRSEDGTSRLVAQDNPPAWHPGDKIRFANGVVSVYN